MSDKRIVVVDIPQNATAEEIERLLNAPYQGGYYYLDTLTFGWPGVGARAIFRLRAAFARDKRPRTNKDRKDEAALVIVRENKHLSNPKIAELLRAAGVGRGKDWVRNRKYDLLAQDGGSVGP